MTSTVGGGESAHGGLECLGSSNACSDSLKFTDCICSLVGKGVEVSACIAELGLN